MKALSTRLFALNEAWKENANIYRQMAKQMNLTDMAMWALYTLRVEPGEMTQSRMCEFLHEPKQTINCAEENGSGRADYAAKRFKSPHENDSPDGRGRSAGA